MNRELFKFPSCHWPTGEWRRSDGLAILIGKPLIFPQVPSIVGTKTIMTEASVNRVKWKSESSRHKNSDNREWQSTARTAEESQEHLTSSVL
jgi:hypothetical protein